MDVEGLAQTAYKVAWRLDWQGEELRGDTRVMADVAAMHEGAKLLRSLTRQLQEYDDVLRSVCFSLGVGGYNSEGLIDPEIASAKISDGIDMLTRWLISQVNDMQEVRDRLTRQLQEAQDMANVGRSLMEQIESNYDSLRGWHPLCDPAEIVVDLINQRDEAERQLQEAVEERDRLRRQLETPTHYWSEDANCMEDAIEWEDFYLLEDCVALEPGEHADFEVTPLIVLPDRKVRVRRTANGEYESAALTERSTD
jgi:predicted nuclease with TOPRIM domain